MLTPVILPYRNHVPKIDPKAFAAPGAVIIGDVEIGPEGQLTTSFNENPQLPFEEFEAHFFGGEKAPLTTPAHVMFHTRWSPMSYSLPGVAAEPDPSAGRPVDRAGGCGTTRSVVAWKHLGGSCRLPEP